MSAAFGVHLGSTSACLAVYKDGKTDVVANAAGDRVTPAIVAFTDHDQSVGLPAKQGMIRNINNSVCNVKQMVGRRYDNPQVQQAKEKSSVKILNNNDRPVYEVDYKERKTTFTTVEIVSSIYKNMREIAQSHGDGDVHDVVLTVPSHFDEDQRKAIIAAGKNAGFTVLRLMSESVAAVLAYDIGQTDTSENLNVLVYRMGGACLDVTVINVNSGMYRVLGNVMGNSIGGHDFTNLLVEHFASEFKRQWKCDVHENKRSMAKLRNSSELSKHILSTMPTCQSSIESLFEGIDFQCSLSRARFEILCNGLLQQCISPIEKALTAAGLEKADIHKVILCGGSTRMPILQQKISDYFSSSEILNRLSPDEVIAIGAAKQAGILTGNEMEEIERNAAESDIACLPVSIMIRLGCGESHVIFPQHTPVPNRRQKTFMLGPDQASCCVQVLQRDSDSSNDQSTLLAKIVMRELPAEAEINAVFHLRSDGSLHVTCTEVKSKIAEDVLIECS